MSILFAFTVFPGLLIATSGTCTESSTDSCAVSETPPPNVEADETNLIQANVQLKKHGSEKDEHTVTLGSRCGSKASHRTCVAVMMSGLFQDMSEKLFQALHQNFLAPQAANAVDVDLFICREVEMNKSVMSSSPEMSSIAHNRQLISYYSEAAIELAKTTPSDGHTMQFDRIAACYKRLIEPLQSRYSFVIRLRPDLMWYAPPPSVRTWNTDAVSARALEYSGPDAITDEDKSYFYNHSATTFGYNRCDPRIASGCGCSVSAAYLGCTRDCDKPELSSCQVVDDQFYIVPTRFANVVFRFELNPREAVNFTSSSPRGWLCGATSLACALWPEYALTRYLMEHKVPFKVMGFKACLVHPMSATIRKPGCGSNWDFKASPTPFHIGHAPPHNGLPALSLQTWSQSLSYSYVALFAVLAALVITAYHLHSTASTDVKISAVASLLYLVTAVTIDILVASSRNDGGKDGTLFLFDPACVVILVELGKLLVSIVLFLGSKSHSNRPWQSIRNDIEAFTRNDIGLLACPAVIFAVNNMLMFFANACNDLSSFGAFRETLILWTALFWIATFKISLGMQRSQALFLLTVGLVLNQVTPLVQATFNLPAILLVCLMSVFNAAGSVCFEFVVKQQATLDLNLQNVVLYFWGILSGLIYLAIWDSQKLSSTKSFFTGFSLTVAVIICAQVFAGLFISRIIKYADSVARSVVASLRGPVLVCLAPLFGLPSKYDILSIISNIIVGSSALYFLLQGKPDAAKASQAVNQREQQTHPA